MSRKTSLATLFLLAIGVASAHAVTMAVDDTASAAPGTPITIGNAASPEYYFVSGTTPFGAPAIYIQAAGTNTVAFPDNGVAQLMLPRVYTDIVGVTATDGDYRLSFDIGSVAYTGFATVTNGGTVIASISDDPVAVVAEPASWTLVSVGLVVSVARLRRRKRAA